jgi:DNA-binding MarR family transcriptional regulator
MDGLPVKIGWVIKTILARQTIYIAGSEAQGGTMGPDGHHAVEEGSGGHSAICLRLMRLFPRVVRGMRRYQDQTTPPAPAPLGPRHVAALEQLRDGPLSVGALAGGLGLTLSTVSGVIAGLDRAGFVERSADLTDRRRTIVEIRPGARTAVERWLDGAAAPLARVLDRLAPAERAAFLKAMDMLEAEFRAADAGPLLAVGPRPDAELRPAAEFLPDAGAA